MCLVWVDGVGEKDGENPKMPELRTATQTMGNPAACQEYAQINALTPLEAPPPIMLGFMVEIKRCFRLSTHCYRKFSNRLYDRASASLESKAWLLKVEVLGTTLYACVQ